MNKLALVLLATIAAQVLVAMALFTPAVLAPVASPDIGVPASAIGAFSALVYLIAVVSAPMGGSYVAQWGAVRVLQVCLALAGIGLAVCGLAHPVLVIAGAAIIGIGYGPVTPASSALLAERAPGKLRNLIMSIRQTGVPIGGAAAGIAGPWLALAAGWRTAVLVIGVAGVLLAAALQPLRREFDRPVDRVPGPRPALVELVRMVFRHAELRRLTISSFGYGGMQMCFASYLVVFLAGPGGLTVVGAGAALSAGMIAGIVGRIAWGLVADYTGNARVLLAAIGVVTAASSAAMVFVGPDWPYGAVLLLSAVFGASAVGWNGVYIAEIARIAPKGQVAAATGGSLSFTYLGAVVGPFIFWLIVAATGSYAVAFGSAALVTLASALLLLRRIPVAEEAA